MKFIRDLLFFELQTTGNNPDKDSILQVSGVLLDKDNLLEKDYFNAYVRVSYLENIIAQHAKLLGIEAEVLKRSAKIYDVAKQFRLKFGNDVLLATHTLTNVLFFKNGFKKAALHFDYEPHIVDLWTLGYIYTLNYGLKKMPTFHTFVSLLGFKNPHPQDAFEKVKLETEIFKKIIKEV